MTRRRLNVSILVGALAQFLWAAAAPAQDAVTRVSVDSGGAEGNRDSFFLAPGVVSADGRHVAFQSWAKNLVPGDRNGVVDVFSHDRLTGATVRLSLNSSGGQVFSGSYTPVLSADGRFIFFSSDSVQLVQGDNNSMFDVFRRDRDPDGNGIFDEGNGVTIRVSVDSSGAESDGNSFAIACSSDGQTIVFQSYADNLVPSDANHKADVFVRDLVAGTTSRVSVDSSGAEGNGDCYDGGVSSDGQVVAFSSLSSNLVANDTNLSDDVFVHDRTTGVTTRVSVDSSGVEGDGSSSSPSISGDGAIVAFTSLADNLVAGDVNLAGDVFVHDRGTAITTRVSVSTSGTEADGYSSAPSISSDGSAVSFASTADNLQPRDTNGVSDVFVHDRATGETTGVSVNCGGSFGDDFSISSSLTADGKLVVFTSKADNLITGDQNSSQDVFVFDRTVQEPPASWSNYGAGFPGTLGIPNLTASAAPVLGTTISVDLDNSYTWWTVALVVVGLGPTSIPTGAGGTWLVDQVYFTIALPIAPGTTAFSTGIPDDPGLCGLSNFLQVLEADGGAAYGLSFTPGLELDFGH